MNRRGGTITESSRSCAKSVNRDLPELSVIVPNVANISEPTFASAH
jgi:hypothetical protein